MVLEYGDSGRSFPKDSIFACKTKSVWRTRARRLFLAMEFTVQVTFLLN